MGTAGVKWVLRAAMAVCGAVLVARTAMGPVWFYSPLNVEGIFAAAALIAVALCASAGGEWKGRSLHPGWLIALVGIAFAPALSHFFLSDDFIIFRHARSMHWNLRQVLMTGGGDGFFRPVVNSSFAMTLPWAGSSPLRWHLISLALHGFCTVLVWRLALALGWARAAAWIAGACFAVHATRPEAAVWITGRFDLLSTIFSLLTLLWMLRGWRWASLAALVLALLSKESAYAVPLLVVLLLWWRKERLTAAIPYFAVAAALFSYRWILFGGIGGYKARGGGAAALSVGVLPVLKTLGQRLWAVLFFPVNWSVGTEWWLAVAIAFYVAVWVWATRGRPSRGRLLLGLAFVVLAALPPLQQLLIGMDLQKARYLYLPSVGFCLFVAAVAEGCRRPWVFAGVVLAFQVAALEHNLRVWGEIAERTRASCRMAASCVRPGERMAVVHLPQSLNGVYFLHNGFEECVQAAAGDATVKADIQDVPSDANGYGCILEWNEGRGQLERVR